MYQEITDDLYPTYDEYLNNLGKLNNFEEDFNDPTIDAIVDELIMDKLENKNESIYKSANVRQNRKTN